jgi:hypothetical protein
MLLEIPLTFPHQSRVQDGWKPSLSPVLNEDHTLDSCHITRFCPPTKTAAQNMAFAFDIDRGPHPLTTPNTTRFTMWPPERVSPFSIEREKERKLNLITTEEAAAKAEEASRLYLQRSQISNLSCCRFASAAMAERYPELCFCRYARRQRERLIPSSARREKRKSLSPRLEGREGLVLSLTFRFFCAVLPDGPSLLQVLTEPMQAAGPNSDSEAPSGKTAKKKSKEK